LAPYAQDGPRSSGLDATAPTAVALVATDDPAVFSCFLDDGHTCLDVTPTGVQKFW